MNHLAHFFLSGDDDDLKIGNFVADFIRIGQVADFSPAVQRGILLHRAIDRFTDEHAQVKTSWRRLYATHGKYAPVVVDIFYDFLLAQNWHKHQKTTNFPSLEAYTEGVYQLLKQRKSELPEPLRSNIDMMINDNWLMHYTTFYGLEKVFIRVKNKARFSGNFELATLSLARELPHLENDFSLFFPDLQHFIHDKM